MTGVSVLTAQVTAEELGGLPGRTELVDGQVRELAPAGYQHGRLSNDIGYEVTRAVRAHALGDVLGAETGFRIARDPDTVRAADLAYVAAARVPADRDERAYFDLAPDLVVEVVSPSERAADVLDKALLWVSAGVRLVWVVHPALRLVQVHTPDGTSRVVRDVLDGGDVLPGLRIDLPALFG